MCIQGRPSNPEFEPIFCPQEMAIQIGSEVCGRCVDWCVWSEMFNTQWPSNEMIYEYLWFHDHLRKMTVRCQWFFADGRWVKWATSSATSESCKLENFSGVMSSGRMLPGSLSQHGCQHVVSISDARFHPFQQILGRECDEVWMPQRVCFLSQQLFTEEKV